jgi:hypothetical protein
MERHANGAGLQSPGSRSAEGSAPWVNRVRIERNPTRCDSPCAVCQSQASRNHSVSPAGVAPIQGAGSISSQSNPGCAPRPWALGWNRFAVVAARHTSERLTVIILCLHLLSRHYTTFHIARTASRCLAWTCAAGRLRLRCRAVSIFAAVPRRNDLRKPPAAGAFARA